jgi:hypothetical protein
MPKNLATWKMGIGRATVWDQPWAKTWKTAKAQKDWGCGSRDKAPASQAEGPEFLSLYQKYPALVIKTYG